MAKLVWTPEAVNDRDSIYTYIESDNPVAALKLDASFSEKAQQLQGYPELGHIGRVTGTRELLIQRNYLLIYDIVEDTVRVLRVLHAARQWPQER